MFLCIVAAVLFGVVHDQVTARVCVEYFTVGHPDILGSEDPTLLGLFWGVAATWWVGLMLGIPLGLAASVGRRPVRSAGSLVRPIALLLGVMALLSLTAGVVGWCLARNGVVRLVGPIASAVDPSRHDRFIADLWAHSASYLVGFVGGAILIVQVWRSRGRELPTATGTRGRA